MRKHLTMREAILYRLTQNLEGSNDFINVFDFMGDIYCSRLGKGGFVSHECSARLSEINKKNKNLLQIEKRKAKYTGNKYYAYRLTPTVTLDSFTDKNLRDFYVSLKPNYKPKPKPEQKVCRHGLPAFVSCSNCK